MKIPWIILILAASSMVGAAPSQKPKDGSPAFFHRDQHAMNVFVQGDSYLNFSIIGADLKVKNFKTDLIPIAHIEFHIDQSALYEIKNFREWFSQESVQKGPDAFIFDEANSLDPDIRAAFRFQSQGKEFIRWPQYPGDKLFNGRIQEYLKSRNIPFRVVPSYFHGYKTASRSLILQDPSSKKYFSYKTSTDRTSQGRSGFQYRPVPVRWSHLTRRLSDLFFKNRALLKSLDVAWEPLAFGFPPISIGEKDVLDTGAQIRLMDDVSRDEKYHLSAFALERSETWKFLSQKTGRTIADLQEKTAQAIDRGITELNLVLGIFITSVHGQNLRVEFDKNWMPTGRVIILDFQDSKPIVEFFLERKEEQLLKDWIRFVGDTNPPVSLTTMGHQWLTAEYQAVGHTTSLIGPVPNSYLFQFGFVRQFSRAESIFTDAIARQHLRASTGLLKTPIVQPVKLKLPGARRFQRGYTYEPRVREDAPRSEADKYWKNYCSQLAAAAESQ